MLPKIRKRILTNVMTLYRDNLQDSTRLSYYAIEYYVRGLHCIRDRLERDQVQAQELCESQKQLHLFED